MSYNVYNPCDDDIINPSCSPCGSMEVELGRVRGLCFVHESYYPVLKADPENVDKWQDGIDQGKILVIPKTSGTFDGGSPVEIAGYGDTESQLIGFKFALAIKDPNLKGNTPFYNTIKKNSSYHVAFRTESLTRISDYPVTVIPKAPVEDDLNSAVVWNVDVKWSGEDQPVPFDTPEGIFQC
jgi:hypothetical protein